MKARGFQGKNSMGKTSLWASKEGVLEGLGGKPLPLILRTILSLGLF
jgi:hypothetical protein